MREVKLYAEKNKKMYQTLVKHNNHKTMFDTAMFDDETDESLEEKTTTLGRYPIKIVGDVSIDDEIETILSVLEPITTQFALRKSHITICENSINENDMIVFGKTVGISHTPYNQEIFIQSGYQHALIHELGHIADRSSDMEVSLPWSHRIEFLDIEMEYRKELLSRSEECSVNEILYFDQKEEIWAHLFEQYFKMKFPEIQLGQTTTENVAGEIAKNLIQKPEVVKYFDDTLSFLHINLSRSLHELSSTQQQI